MAEQEPQGYQFKHRTRVSLDEYRGVARDIMELNAPVADGFMQTADMRGDIVIVQKPQERARDYDQIGTVRVAKFLQMPRLDVWNRNNTVQTRKEDDTWYVAIDDQELAQNVARSPDGTGKFNDRYVNAFQQELKKGMKDVLKREKLLNGGEYNFAFLVSYHNFLVHNLLTLPLLELEILLQSSNIAQAADGTAKIAVAYAGVNAAFNGFNLFCSLVGNFLEKKGGISRDKRMIRDADFEEPFIRHSIPEYIMPTVPVDRLLRGMKYLRDHGNELVEQVK